MGAGLLLRRLLGGGLGNLFGKILDFLRSPVGIVVCIGVFGFVCYTAGKWNEREVCRLEKQASISAARDIDQGASLNADEGLKQALEEANERLLAAQAQLREQADETARLPEELRRARLPTESEWRRLREPEGGVRRAGKKPSKRR